MKKQNLAFLNANNRIECNGVEFSSGSAVRVLIDGEWLETTIEHFDDIYQSVDGYPLIGNQVKRL